MARTTRSRPASVKSHPSRLLAVRPHAEQLEARVVPSTLEVELIPGFDEFGNQYATIQVYRNDDGLGDRVTFGIYDTGASPVTVGWVDQWFFDELGQPIPVIDGATVEAHGIGGSLTGLVSQPGTLLADGLHSLDLDILLNGTGEYIDLSKAAAAAGVQMMIGTESGSPDLPTITGTPIMNGSLAGSQVEGVAALIDQYGYLIDFGELFPGLGFDGLILPMPDLFFVEPGTQLEPTEETSEVVRLPVSFLGIDNHLDPGETVTESYNPTITDVRLTNTIDSASFDVGGQTLLFDTGAQLSVISTELALSLGLNLDKPEMEIDVGGAGGTLTVGGYYIDSLTLPRDDNNDGVVDGELIYTNVPVFVLDIGAGLDGILGMNLLNPAYQMIYDPWDPDGEAGPAGPSIQMTFSNGDRYQYDPGDINLLNSLFPYFAGMLGGASLPGFNFNQAPTISADEPAVTTSEGQSATNTGTFSDADGDAINITADVGTVTWDDAAGTWKWSLATTDGPDGPITVTVTASDGRGGEKSTSFTYSVADVAPTIALSGDSTANAQTNYTLQLGAVTDPGDDTITGYEVHWGDGTSSGFIAGAPTGQTLQHVYSTAGVRTITVDLYNEDGTHRAAGSKTITVENSVPDLRVRIRGTPIWVAPGGLATFSIAIANVGTADATGASVIFNVPAGMRLLVGRSTPGWEKIGPRKFRFDLGTVEAGESARVIYLKTRLVARFPTGTQLLSSARIFDDGLNGPDANLKNNRFLWRTWVR